MARKFLQMGYTRSRRYANHKSGRKYQQDAHDSHDKKEVLPYEAGGRREEVFSFWTITFVVQFIYVLLLSNTLPRAIIYN